MNNGSPTPLQSIVTAMFVGTWLVLGISGYVASRRMTAAEKRYWMPRWMCLIGGLFVGFSTLLTWLQSPKWSSLAILIPVVPMVCLIAYLNIKFTKFCDNCNATQYNHNWFDPQRFCSKCGAPLDTVKPERGEDLWE